MAGFYDSPQGEEQARKVREKLTANGFVERTDIKVDSSVLFVKKALPISALT